MITLHRRTDRQKPYNIPKYEHPRIKDSIDVIEMKPRFTWHVDGRWYSLQAIVGMCPDRPIIYGKHHGAYLNLDIIFTIKFNGMNDMIFKGDEFDAGDSVPDIVLSQQSHSTGDYDRFLSLISNREQFFKDSNEVVSRAYFGFLSDAKDIVDCTEFGGYRSIYTDIDTFLKQEMEFIK